MSLMCSSVDINDITNLVWVIGRTIIEDKVVDFKSEDDDFESKLIKIDDVLHCFKQF